ncbi:MAG TPA: exodeoxyribonuclease VII large subunit [Candidatus Acidoferrum sp.]|nr:exodeoxyribonuclease VII large subunit [Candidatus Acidoferrum sp.]
MAGKIKSQWDFAGELFPTAEMRRVFSVTEVTTTVRRLIEERVGIVWVTGEITNLRAQSSGHLYFSVKDASAQLTCVCFRDDARSTRHLLRDGQKVVLHGEMTVYEARGQYQLIVREVELEGVGALQAAFERLKQKLNAEGLFASERKREIPEYVQRIGLVTSPAGAAIRDVLHVIERRQPSLEIVFASSRVQGQGAHDEIACAIRWLNEWSASGNRLDAILITRGGGSLEDLWAFNEEAVARAIFHSQVPVISAVGHEIDFTISDFVADLRAATPSAAAELLTEGMWQRQQWLAAASRHLIELAKARVDIERETVSRLAARLARAHPKRKLNERLQQLDELQTSLSRCTKRGWNRHREKLVSLQQRLSRLRPSREIPLRRELLADITQRLHENAEHELFVRKQRLLVARERLRLLSPRNVLERGFSVTRDAATGKLLRDSNSTEPGQKLITQLQNGEVQSVVTR